MTSRYTRHKLKEGTFIWYTPRFHCPACGRNLSMEIPLTVVKVRPVKEVKE